MITDTVLDKVRSAIEKYGMFDGVDDVVIGLSGGADSVCLTYILDLLKDEYGITVRTAHLNHGIRGPEAESDADFARGFSEKLGLRFDLRCVDCISEAEKQSETLEECGRRLRYEFFDSLAGEKSVIATAHNADDNAETVLFNISRGASLKGASGIPPARNNVVRPLIRCSRAEIEAFCKENSLAYVTDKTNLSDDYTRNRIRHNCLAQLKCINPSAVDSFSGFSERASEIYDYLLENTRALIKETDMGDNRYDAEVLSGCHPALMKNTVKLLIDGFCGFSCDSSCVSRVCDILENGGRVQLYDDYTCEVIKGVLRFFKRDCTPDQGEICPLNVPFDGNFGPYSVKIEHFSKCSEKVHHLLLDNLIDYDKIQGNLVLRTRKGGDTLSLTSRKVTKSLKKLFNETAVPLELRDKLPVIADDAGVVWVCSFGVDSRVRVTSGSLNVLSVKGEKKNED